MWLAVACGGQSFETGQGGNASGAASSTAAGGGSGSGSSGSGSSGSGSSGSGSSGQTALLGAVDGSTSVGNAAGGASGASGSCLPGTYEGPFQGTYSSPATLLAVPMAVAGHMTMIFVATADPNILTMQGSRLAGTADAGLGSADAAVGTSQPVTFSGDLVGKLDCAQGMLVDAGVVNGTYNLSGASFAFEGPIQGRYDAAAHAFVGGTWSLVDKTMPTTAYGGSGTWSAALVP